MNHLLMKKRAFMAIVNQIKGIKAIKTGTFPVTLPGCVDNDCIIEYKIYGNTVTGKNVFDITKCNDYKSEHGGIYFSASRPRGGHNQGKVSDVTNMEAGKTYVITADTTSSSGNFVYLNGSAKVWHWGQAYTPTEKDIAGKIYFYKATNDSDPDVTQDVIISNVQIEEAAVATEYEPYHVSYVGDLSDGKYNIPIVTRGKNVFDITKCNDYDSTKNGIYLPESINRQTSQGKVSTITNMIAGKTYVISAESSYSTGHFVYFKGSSRVIHWGTSFIPTQKDIDSDIVFYKHTESNPPDDDAKNVTITNVQIEEAAAATEYEPYHAPVTTTISLPAPLSAGEYISYTAQAIIHADDTKTSASLPKIPTYKGTTVLECNTEIAPQSAEITYYTNEEE